MKSIDQEMWIWGPNNLQNWTKTSLSQFAFFWYRGSLKRIARPQFLLNRPEILCVCQKSMFHLMLLSGFFWKFFVQVPRPFLWKIDLFFGFLGVAPERKIRLFYDWICLIFHPFLQFLSQIRKNFAEKFVQIKSRTMYF